LRQDHSFPREIAEMNPDVAAFARHPAVRYDGTMPALKNARQERFVQGLMKGQKQHVAYERAGYRAKTRTVADVNATRLSSLPHVRARLAELQERQAKRLDVTVDDLIRELEAARVKAMRAKQLAAAIAATMGKARLLGFLTEKVGLDVTLRKPMREPGEIKQMSLEEWQKRFAPKLIEGEPNPDPPMKGNGNLN
jgi:hypothetical protein